MRLLVITQAVDTENTTLGFFHGWILEMATRADFVQVICLYEGKHHLPDNVAIHSLGKESGLPKIAYVFNFFRYIWNVRHEYDVVFVHMNQEYVLLGGVLWKILHKKIFLWRNHPYGNFLTRAAMWLSNTVFCTSDKSFTAHSGKTVLMPVGIDTQVFRKDTQVPRKPKSLLMFGRISPVKHIERGIEVVEMLVYSGTTCTLSIVGDVLSRDMHYYEKLKQLVVEKHLEKYVTFVPGVDFLRAPDIYRSHEIFLNFTDVGSFDKTVFEALACGTKVLTTNTSMEHLLPHRSFAPLDTEKICLGIRQFLDFDLTQTKEYDAVAQALVEKHSLASLVQTLFTKFHV